MKVVTLVPWRGGDAGREATWDTTRAHLESYGWPLVTGDSLGPWNRSAAVNAAADSAGSWDVAVIADADTIHGPDVNLAGVVQRVHTNDTAIVPWTTRWRLSRAASADITATIATFDVRRDLDMSDGFADNHRISNYPTWRVGSTTVISRSAWERVGGMDEGFVGWGFEDCSHRMALETLAYLGRAGGTIYHLWHPHDSRGNPANRMRFKRYRAAHGNPAAMLDLLHKLKVL